MGRTILDLALTVVVLLGMAAQAPGQESYRPSNLVSADTPLLTTDVLLRESLRRIFRGSATWREAMAAVRETGRQAIVVTPVDPIAARAKWAVDRRSDSAGVAEVVPAVGEDSRVGFVLVIVNVPLVQRLHDARMSPLRDFEADLDRIVVHEVYGHAVPYLLAGSLSSRCPDPTAGERPADACAIKRENVVRAELGLGRRTDSGLDSLALLRRGSSLRRGSF